MTESGLITPFVIANELSADQEPEAPYSWSQQVRNQEVSREDLAKPQEGLGGRRPRRSAAQDPSSAPASPA